MASLPVRGKTSIEKKQRNGPLSLALYQHFVDYLCGEFLPSPEQLLHAGFKSDASHHFKMQEKFMFWATKMSYDEESGYIVHKQSQKFIIPKEKFEEAIRQAHVTDFSELERLSRGATPSCESVMEGQRSQRKHNGLHATLKNLQSVYTFGRRSFGITTEEVKKVLRKCAEKDCCVYSRMKPRKTSTTGSCTEPDFEDQDMQLQDEDTDEYGKEDEPTKEAFNVAEDEDPYDLVFGCPDEVPDFGCSDAYKSNDLMDDDVFQKIEKEKERFYSSYRENIPPHSKDLPQSNIVSHRSDPNDMPIHTSTVYSHCAEKRPRLEASCGMPRPSTSQVLAPPPEDSGSAEVSSGNDRPDVNKTVDGAKCTSTTLDGVTFYEYEYPEEDANKKTMSLPKQRRKKESDDEDAEYAPRQWKRWKQVEHTPLTRRCSSSDNEKQTHVRNPGLSHSLSMGTLDYLDIVSDISSDEEPDCAITDPGGSLNSNWHQRLQNLNHRQRVGSYFEGGGHMGTSVGQSQSKNVGKTIGDPHGKTRGRSYPSSTITSDIGSGFLEHSRRNSDQSYANNPRFEQGDISKMARHTITSEAETYLGSSFNLRLEGLADDKDNSSVPRGLDSSQSLNSRSTSKGREEVLSDDRSSSEQKNIKSTEKQCETDVSHSRRLNENNGSNVFEHSRRSSPLPITTFRCLTSKEAYDQSPSRIPIGVIHPLKHSKIHVADQEKGRSACATAEQAIVIDHENSPSQSHNTQNTPDQAHSEFSTTKGDDIETPLSPVLRKSDPNIPLPVTPNNSPITKRNDKTPPTKSGTQSQVGSDADIMYVSVGEPEAGGPEGDIGLMSVGSIKSADNELKTSDSKQSWGHFRLRDGQLRKRKAFVPSKITKNQGYSKDAFPTITFSPTKLSHSGQISPIPLTMGGNIYLTQSPPTKDQTTSASNMSPTNVKKSLMVFAGKDGMYYCVEPKAKGLRSILPKTKIDPDNPNQKVDNISLTAGRKSSPKTKASLPIQVKLVREKEPPASNSSRLRNPMADSINKQATNVRPIEEYVVVGGPKVLHEKPGSLKSIFRKRKVPIDNTVTKTDVVDFHEQDVPSAKTRCLGGRSDDEPLCVGQERVKDKDVSDLPDDDSCNIELVPELSLGREPTGQDSVTDRTPKETTLFNVGNCSSSFYDYEDLCYAAGGCAAEIEKNIGLKNTESDAFSCQVEGEIQETLKQSKEDDYSDCRPMSDHQEQLMPKEKQIASSSKDQTGVSQGDENNNDSNVQHQEEFKKKELVKMGAGRKLDSVKSLEINVNEKEECRRDRRESSDESSLSPLKVLTPKVDATPEVTLVDITEECQDKTESMRRDVNTVRSPVKVLRVIKGTRKGGCYAARSGPVQLNFGAAKTSVTVSGERKLNKERTSNIMTTNNEVKHNTDNLHQFDKRIGSINLGIARAELLRSKLKIQEKVLALRLRQLEAKKEMADAHEDSYSRCKSKLKSTEDYIVRAKIRAKVEEVMKEQNMKKMAMMKQRSKDTGFPASGKSGMPISMLSTSRAQLKNAINQSNPISRMPRPSLVPIAAKGKEIVKRSQGTDQVRGHNMGAPKELMTSKSWTGKLISSGSQGTDQVRGHNMGAPKELMTSKSWTGKLISTGSRGMDQVRGHNMGAPKELMTSKSLTGKLISSGIKFYNVKPKMTTAYSTATNSTTHTINTNSDSSEIVCKKMKTISLSKDIQRNLLDVQRPSKYEVEEKTTTKRVLDFPTKSEPKSELSETKQIGCENLQKDSEIPDEEKAVSKRGKRRKRTRSGGYEPMRKSNEEVKRKNPILIGSMPLPIAAHFSKVATCKLSSKPQDGSDVPTHLPVMNQVGTCLPPVSSSDDLYSASGVTKPPTISYANSHAPSNTMKCLGSTFTTKLDKSDYKTPKKQQRRHEDRTLGTTPGKYPNPNNIERRSICKTEGSTVDQFKGSFLPPVVGVDAGKIREADNESKRGMNEYEQLTSTISDIKNFIRPAVAGRRYSLDVLGKLLFPRACNQIKKFRQTLDLLDIQ